MNWLSRRNNSNLSDPTPLQSLKSRQIERLKTFSVTEILRDLEYWIQFKINGQKHDLVITLPPQFPYDKPMIQVKPPVRHSLLNEQSIVTNFSPLNEFAVHSDLGGVVRQILDEFSRNPPTPASQPAFNLPYPIQSAAVINSSYAPQASYPLHPVSTNSISSFSPVTNDNKNLPVTCTSSYAPPPYSNYAPSSYYDPNLGKSIYQATAGNNAVMSTFSMPTQFAMNTNAYPNDAIPNMPNISPFIQELSFSELKEANENVEKYMSFILSLPELQNLEKQKEDVISKNEQLAKMNLSVKPILEKLKKDLLESFDQLNDAQSKASLVFQTQNELLGKNDTSAIIGKLKAAISEADISSEDISENFISGEISVDEFIKKYTESRKIYYNRKAVEEKISKQLLKQNFSR